jgi:hypothetical protein
MAFNSSKLSIQTIGITEADTRVLGYITSDALVTVKASGYFNGAAIRLGDSINAVCNGVQAEFQVSGISPATVVTNTQT